MLLLGSTAWAQTSYFWDSDGATAGFGDTTGTWGASAFWSTSSAGTAATANSTITTNDTVNFGTASLNYTNATVTGPATAQGFLNMNFGSGQTTALTLSGGTLNLASTSTITQNRTSADMVVSTLLQGSGSALVVAGTGTLTLSGNNTFTGGLTLQGTGQLNLAHANAAGTGTIFLKSTETGADVTLGLTNGITVTNPISIDSTTGREGINSTGGSNISLTGGITITGATNRTIFIGNSQSGSSTLTVSGGISGASFPGTVSLRGGQSGSVGFLNGAVNLPNGSMDLNGNTTWTLNTAGSSYTQFAVAAVSSGIILGTNNAIATNARLEVNAGATGSLDLNGFNQSLRGLGGGAASFSITNSSTTTDSTLTLAGFTADRSFAGVIRDGAARKVSLVINSPGFTQTLSGASTFSGGVTLQGTGQLALANSSAAGTGTIFLQSEQTGPGVTLGLTNGITVTNAISIDSTTGREHIASTGTGNNSLTGGIAITGGSNNTIIIANAQTSGNLTVSGGISAPSYTGQISLRGSQVGNVGFLNGAVNAPTDPNGGIDLNGSTTWTLNTAGSSYQRFGVSAVSGGIVLGTNNAIATNSRLDVNVAATGSIDLNGFNQSLRGLTAGGASFSITNSSTTSDSTLTLAGLTFDRSFAGVIRDGATRRVSLVMNSPGRTQTLSGTNTYTGNTTVSAGTLNLATNGSLRFVIGGNGTNTAILGSGTTVIDGRFAFDLAGASTTVGHSWTIVASTLTNSYGTNFLVTGFSGAGGLWTNTTNGVNYVFAQSNSTLSVQSTGSAVPYDAWVAYWTNAVPGFTNTAGTADPDGDQFNNNEEFAFDGNPTVGSPALLTATKVGTNAVFSFVARKDPPGGASYQVQFTGNLTTGWTNSAVTVSNSANTNGINIPADYQRKEFTVPAAGREFYRVEASITP